MTFKCCRRFFWLLVLSGLFASRTFALIIDPLSIESLTAQADLVLQGKVRSKTCLRDPAGRIYTKVELDVTDLWKGAIEGSPFTIVQGGGILGEQEAVVAGQVEYRLGEEVVAFLVRNARGEGVTLGLMQGKFDVWQDSVRQTKYVCNPFHGLGKTAAAVALQSTGKGGGRPKPLLLLELKKQVVGGAR